MVECLGEECMHHGEGMHPAQFEAHCGRERSKKWKESIFLLAETSPPWAQPRSRSHPSAKKATLPRRTAALRPAADKIQKHRARPREPHMPAIHGREDSRGTTLDATDGTALDATDGTALDAVIQPPSPEKIQLVRADVILDVSTKKAAERKERKRKRAKVMKVGWASLIVVSFSRGLQCVCRAGLTNKSDYGLRPNLS